MQRDEIIEMAKQAGLIVNSPYLMPHDHVLRGIESFAKLVAAKEREACAVVCEDLQAPPHVSDSDVSMWDVTSLECADAIRARGEA